MNSTAKASSAKTEPSSVNQVIALLHTSAAMEIVIVVTCLMKLIAHRDSLVVATVLKRDSNVTTTSASQTRTFAMGRMIAVITLMKLQLFART